MSKAYLVRTIDGRELVGFFVVRSLDDLYWTIDEALNPKECEYRRVRSGGIVWPNPNTPKLTDIDSDEDTEDLSGACFSEKLLYVVYGEEGFRWRKFRLCRRAA